MSNLDITFDSFKLDNEEIINMDIKNIPKVISNCLIFNKIIIPKCDEDLKLMRMIYSTNLYDMNLLYIFLMESMKNLNINDKNHIIIHNYMNDLVNEILDFDDNRIEKKNVKIMKHK